MSGFRKLAFVGLTAMALGVASISAFADKGHCDRMGGNSAKHSAWIEKKQARLHDKLNLSAEQEAAWKTYIEKSKRSATETRPTRSELAALSSPERMERMLARMKERQGHMEERLAALKEFYAVLTPEQQKVFDAQHTRHGRNT